MTAKEFKAARLRLGYTQKEFAVEIFVQERHVQRLEAGDTPIKKTLAFFIENLPKKSK